MAINALKTQSVGNGIKRRYLMTSGQFIVPEGVSRLRVIAAGAGGGGCGSFSWYSTGFGAAITGGQGGYSGYLREFSVNVESGQIINYTLGAGGAGGAGISRDLASISASGTAVYNGPNGGDRGGTPGTGGSTIFAGVETLGGPGGQNTAYYTFYAATGGQMAGTTGTFNSSALTASYGNDNTNINNQQPSNGPALGGFGAGMILNGANSESPTAGYDGFLHYMYAFGRAANSLILEGNMPDTNVERYGFDAPRTLQLAGGGGSGNLYRSWNNGNGGGPFSLGTAGGAGGNPTPILLTSTATNGGPSTLTAITNTPTAANSGLPNLVGHTSFGVAPAFGGGGRSGSASQVNTQTAPGAATAVSRFIGTMTPGQGGDGGYGCGGGAAGVGFSTTAANTLTARGGNGGQGFVIVEWRE